MKEKLFLLAAFIALNVAAQPDVTNSSDYDAPLLAGVNAFDDAPRNVAISLQLDVKKEVLKVRASQPVSELAIINLYGKKLIRKRFGNSLKLSSLPRGVYELEIRAKGAVVRKRIILQ